MPTIRRILHDFGGLGIAVVLMALVTFLPPDTSLREIETRGAISACVPVSYPPLVTGDPAKPGIDIEILRAVADKLGVRLLLSPNAAMGRDFNPRNWAITRAGCQVLAGGVVDSPLTRSFLETGPPYARTGWAVVAPEPLDNIDGKTLGALTLLSGLDRIGLSSYLRSKDATVRVTRDRLQLVDGISSGAFDGGVTEALLAAGIASENDWWTAFMPSELARYNLVFGLWKGDLTLKREIDQAFRELEADGTLAAILKRYGAMPLGQMGAVPSL